MFNLVSLTDRWSPGAHLFKAFVVAFFVRLLDKAGYFGEDDRGDEYTKEKRLIGNIKILQGFRK